MYMTRMVAGLTAGFDFSRDLPVAKCGRACVELHHHPRLFPERPWSIEPFFQSGDGFGHYSGSQFAERPTPEEFVEIAIAMFESLARDDRLI